VHILLSVLVASVPEKITYLARKASKWMPVEVLILIDNKKRHIGMKRNTLIERAQGNYVVFVDDGNQIEVDYIQSLVETLLQNQNADCVRFDVEVNTCGLERKVTKYSPPYTNYETD
jgi:glycosyltransferase involved in cell wall biosynthesis